jgi:transposase InsO family protein
VTAWLRTVELPHGSQQWLAQLLGVTPRTLQEWIKCDPSARRPGRPAAPAALRWSVMRAVARQGRIRGHGAGRLEMAHALRQGTPRRLIVASLKRLKGRWRRDERERLAGGRLSIEVLYRDVLWSQDATHLGRTGRQEVRAQVCKEAASRRTLLARAQAGASCAADVIGQLEELRVERGLPLILAMDNGPENIAQEVEAYAARQQVVLLYNVPRTPQHNARAERGIGELKQESGLGKGVRLGSVQEAQARLDAARERLDRHRLRACLGYVTAEQADRTLPCWYGVVDRGSFYAAVCSATEQAVLGARTLVERRRAERKAILGVVASLGVIRITRGGVLLSAVKCEGVS